MTLQAIDQLLINLTLPKQGYRFGYDFSVQGGEVGSLALVQSDGPLPDSFVIQNALVDVVVVPESLGAATLGITSGESAGDLVAPIVIAGAPWSTPGLKVTLVLAQTILTLFKTGAVRHPAIVIGVAPLTAGKINLLIEGWVSN